LTFYENVSDNTAIKTNKEETISYLGVDIGEEKRDSMLHPVTHCNACMIFGEESAT
jgi:hypothetical protein